MANLRLEVAKQLSFIDASCMLYDRGRTEEALRIAVATRVLFHNTKNSRAIIGGHSGSSNLKLLSTTMYRPSENGNMPLGFLCLYPSKGIFKPHLVNSDRNEQIHWNDWWEKEPILQIGKNNTREVITRRQVVLACANKDGGAHVDSVKPKEYKRLEDGIGYSVEVGFASGTIRKVKFRHANLAVVRQIGHEILHSQDLIALFENDDLEIKN